MSSRLPSLLGGQICIEWRVDASDTNEKPMLRNFIRMAKNLRDVDMAAMVNPNRIVIPGPIGKEGILLQCGYPLSKVISWSTLTLDQG
jgi:hypothetical protein